LCYVRDWIFIPFRDTAFDFAAANGL